LDGLPIDKIAQNVGALHAFDEKSARLIAQTESTRTTNLAQNQAFKDAQGFGIRIRKQWLSARNSDVRDSHAELDGQVRDINENFSTLAGATGPAPASMDTPSENYNCRCSMISVIDSDEPIQGWEKPKK
jgi:uncharacterized protein with gpF-like domain